MKIKLVEANEQKHTCIDCGCQEFDVSGKVFVDAVLSPTGTLDIDTLDFSNKEIQMRCSNCSSTKIVNTIELEAMAQEATELNLDEPEEENPEEENPEEVLSNLFDTLVNTAESFRDSLRELTQEQRDTLFKRYGRSYRILYGKLGDMYIICTTDLNSIEYYLGFEYIRDNISFMIKNGEWSIIFYEENDGIMRFFDLLELEYEEE